jgi:hypothetical protein
LTVKSFSPFDTIWLTAYFLPMEKQKSRFDIGVYLFYGVAIAGLFAVVWRATDFFTAVAAVQFFGPIIILLCIGPSMVCGEMIDAVAKLWTKWFSNEEPPDTPAAGHHAHTTA